MNFNPFPELKTGRLLLRRMIPSDAKELYFLRSDDTVLRYLGRNKEQSIETTLAFINKINANIDRNESILWGIAEICNPDLLIGSICLWQFQPENSRCEIGYALHPDHWGKGLMKEAAVEVIKYGREKLELHSIEGHIHPDNIASAKLLEATGFSKEAHFRESYFFNGVYYDTVVYGKILD